jgi:hypothetical protein
MNQRREILSERIDRFFKMAYILTLVAGLSFFVIAFVWNLIK